MGPTPFSRVSFRFVSCLMGREAPTLITLTSLSYISHMSFTGFGAEEEEEEEAALPFAY